MADTHILEGNFEIRPGSCRRPAAVHAFAAAPSFAERWSSLLADSFFAVLERLKLCQAPRILHAECFIQPVEQQAARDRTARQIIEARSPLQ